jgi:nicotinamide-nucleotide amidase
MFRYGWVTYANEAKTKALGVPIELLEQHGAVSAPVAEAMARGALRESGADIAVAVTGIAGPNGGTAEKPVGLVYLAIAERNGTGQVVERTLSKVRSTFKMMASQVALDLIRRSLQK